MNKLTRLVVASVATCSVFERFAKLSDKDKAVVVKKVKEKVNGKGKKDEKPPKGKKEETPPEEVVDEKSEGTKEVPAKKDETTPAKKLEDAAKGKTEETTEEAPDMQGIVDGLVKEVEVIKSDGQITPAEVLGLVDNIVQMVGLLVSAKPLRQPKAASREKRITAKLVAERTAGHSYAVKRLTLEVEGWYPVNVDVLRAIGQIWFDAEDDQGEELEGNMTSLRYDRISPRKYLTHGEEQAMKKRGEAPVQSITGMIPKGSHRAAAKALARMLKQKFGLKVIKSKTSR